MKQVSYFIEAVLVYALYGIFALMGPRMASATGGWIGRTLGPHLGASRKALNNLRLVMPEKSADEHAAIIRAMWDNLGRVIAEYPHLKTIARDYTDIHGTDYIPVDGKPFVFVTGHIANWEAGHVAINIKTGTPYHVVYRSLNNPFVDRLVARCRKVEGQLPLLAKSRAGTRSMVESMAEGQPLLILIDQKYNEGVAAPFMGQPAMTSDAFVRFARKFDAPLIPYRIERVEGCRFRVSILPPLPTEGLDDTQVIRVAHALLEEWIRERPGQWLWLHRRWDSAALK